MRIYTRMRIRKAVQMNMRDTLHSLKNFGKSKTTTTPEQQSPQQTASTPNAKPDTTKLTPPTSATEELLACMTIEQTDDMTRRGLLNKQDKVNTQF